ncbi:hypothetical protein ACIPZC_24340 [Pseudomonas sp. NPDC089743]|uniref:hypothetical protein n=1 Tax=Pseudomonas sp. NPDC089743 TaxID=3364471 RepID=UPI00381D7C15
MHRDKGIALRLIDILVEEPTGAGMHRAELRQEFSETDLGAGLNTEDLWNLVDYHLRLLETAGFVKMTKDEDAAINTEFDYFEMTWAGHNYQEQNATAFIPEEILVG